MLPFLQVWCTSYMRSVGDITHVGVDTSLALLLSLCIVRVT